MRKISYPKDIDRLKLEYYDVFLGQIDALQEKWEELRPELMVSCAGTAYQADADTIFPADITTILIADYSQLVDIYIAYRELVNQNRISNDLHEKLKPCFNYKGYNAWFKDFQPDISKFFMKHAEELDLHVCHYCELSYINVYGFYSVYHDFAAFLYNAPDKELMKYIRKADGLPYKDRYYKKVISLRTNPRITHENIVEKFDGLDKRIGKDGKKSESIINKLKNHFDLDHFLPKSRCPLVALSLMNFVPSCPICNEKLKKDDEIGRLDRDALLKLSPTSNDYNFDDEVEIRVICNNGPNGLMAQNHPDDYTVKFCTNDNDYQEGIIDEFHLNERYNYHKCEALRLQDLMLNYPKEKIQAMSFALKGYRTEAEISEDLFGEHFSKEHHRCFDKLRRDVLSSKNNHKSI